MLKDLWNRLFGGRDNAADVAEAEEAEALPGEPPPHAQSIDDVQADNVAEEHLGGFDPDRLVEEDELPH
jgi:hypothetical protein